MRSPPSAARSRTRGQTHGHRSDAGHDLALGQMPMAHDARPPSVLSLSAWPPQEARNLGLHCLRQQRSRAVAQHISQQIGETPLAEPA